MRISLPLVSTRIAVKAPTLAAAARTRRMRSACSGKDPWERLSRATFMPARIISSMTSGASLAGPMVAMIFVRLGRKRRGVAEGVISDMDPLCVGEGKPLVSA